eukprot:gene15960-15886_t
MQETIQYLEGRVARLENPQQQQQDNRGSSAEIIPFPLQEAEAAHRTGAGTAEDAGEPLPLSFQPNSNSTEDIVAAVTNTQRLSAATSSRGSGTAINQSFLTFEPSRDSVTSNAMSEPRTSNGSAAQQHGQHASSVSITVGSETESILSVPSSLSEEAGNFVATNKLGTIPNAVPPLVSPRGPRNGHNRGAASTAIPNPRPSPRIPKRRESKPPLLSDGAIDRGDILREALQDDAGVEWEEEVMTNTMRIKTSVHSDETNDVAVTDHFTQYYKDNPDKKPPAIEPPAPPSAAGNGDPTGDPSFTAQAPPPPPPTAPADYDGTVGSGPAATAASNRDFKLASKPATTAAAAAAATGAA